MIQEPDDDDVDLDRILIAPDPQPRKNVRQRKSPMSKPEVLNVVPLDHARIIKKRGRPRKLEMPPLPQEIFDGMSDLEVRLFDYFVYVYKEKYHLEDGDDLIMLNMAAMDFIQTLRVQAKQMKDGEIISMARQHPAVQLRAWLDQMDVTRKANKSTNKKGGDDAIAEAREAMRKLSS